MSHRKQSCARQRCPRGLRCLFPLLVLLDYQTSLLCSAADTKTVTYTQSVSPSSSYSLPTGTASFSGSLSATVSNSPTLTTTASLSASFKGHNNFTTAMAPSPTVLTEGQEFRIKIISVLESEATTEVQNAFIMNSTTDIMTFRVHTWAAALAGDCNAYSATPSSLLYESTNYGFSYESFAHNAMYTSELYATLSAPKAGHKFVICYYHHVPERYSYTYANSWVLFTLENQAMTATEVAPGEVYVFAAKEAVARYSFASATEGQFAVLQLTSTETFNFTYSPSSCKEADVFCKKGDFLKLVPEGTPCTQERTAQDLGSGLSYYGSATVDDYGYWVSDSSVFYSMREGATVGGVGLFGTQFLNPLVDVWDSYGEYPSEATNTKHAYVYVTFPAANTSYDVCYTGQHQRLNVRAQNTTAIPDTPVWTKLFPTAYSTANPHGSFFSDYESITWSVTDTTPNSWGEITFQDPASYLDSTPHRKNGLSDALNVAQNNWHIIENYYTPLGGDAYKIITAEVLAGDRYRSPLRNGTEGGRGKSLGSVSPRGCWDVVATESLYEGNAIAPQGSFDLTWERTHQGEVTGAVYIPSTLADHSVCYRRTCNSANSATGCPLHAGWRMMRQRLRPAAPLASATLFGQPPPPPTTWYMNDTREGTWGPLVIETVAVDLKLDQREWSGLGNGSRVRLVRSDRGCVSPNFMSGVGEGGAEGVDAGLTECNSLSAGEVGNRFCLGSAADYENATTAAFYIRVPSKLTTYRVCLQHGLWNWREVSPAGHRPQNDVYYPQPDPFLQRMDWQSPAQYQPTDNPLFSISIVTTENREQQQTYFLIDSAQADLTIAPRQQCADGCEASGDVLRVVPHDTACDINYLNWNPALADTLLSGRCPTAGWGGTDITYSGLFGSGACARNVFISQVCNQSKVCDNSAAAASLQHMLQSTDTLSDDVIPGDTVLSERITASVGVITLPSFDKASVFDNTYKVCFKQAGLQNWIIANETITVKRTDIAYIKVMPAPADRHLVAGEHTTFSVEWRSINSEEWKAWKARGGLAAKLIEVDPLNPLENQNCLLPPGSTESAQFSAYATYANESGPKVFDFHVTAPHRTGRYQLCIKVGYEMSWYALSDLYTVSDNGLRWFVRPGHAPKNNGVTTVQLRRCTASYSTLWRVTSCARLTSTEKFQISAGKDSAKVVESTQSCPTGLHAGVNGGGAAGVVDLGPGSGVSDTADFSVTLPPAANDIQKIYKVCVRTEIKDPKFGPTPRTMWVEVTQDTDSAEDREEVRYLQDGASRPVFITEPSDIFYVNMSARLTPVNTQSSAVEVLSGVSTVLVDQPFSSAPSSAPPLYGLTLHAYSTSKFKSFFGYQNLFKFVQRRGGSGSCLDNAVEGTTNVNIGSLCTASSSQTCPHVTNYTGSALPVAFNLVLQFPVTPGEYILCYKLTHADLTSTHAWQMVPMRPGQNYSDITEAQVNPNYTITVVDSFLGVDVTPTNLTLIDSAVNNSVSLASWCKSGTSSFGMDCATQNNFGYQFDLVSVANGTAVCPTPYASPTGSTSVDSTQWFVVSPVSAISAALKSPSGANSLGSYYSMPPAAAALSGRYKVCLYKAAQTAGANASTGHVSRGGVTYQVLNKGVTEEGGGSGYWKQANLAQSADPAFITVQSSLLYNSSIRFSEFHADIPMKYSDQLVGQYLTDEDNGQFSRTPLVRSGSVVEFDVQLSLADGSAVSFGRYPVTVVRCFSPPTDKNWEGLKCTHYKPPDQQGDVGVFSVQNFAGECPAEAATNFGWPSSGLKQFLRDGAASFKLQYRSRCSGAFGCGVRFVSKISDTLTVYSRPFWVNVYRRYPTDIRLTQTDVQPPRPASSVTKTVNGNAETFVSINCFHHVSCPLIIEGYWAGFREYGSKGNVSVLHSHASYGTSRLNQTIKVLEPVVVPASVVEVPSTEWSNNGDLRHTYKISLQPYTASASLYLQARYGTPDQVLTKLISINVKRRTPATIRMGTVRPLDAGLALGRSPAPAFSSVRVGTSTLLAQAGSHLESLVPYEVTYLPYSADGSLIAPEEGLDGWFVSAEVIAPGAIKNAVLGVIVAGDPPQLSPDNFETTPNTLSTPVYKNPFSGWQHEKVSEWKILFRIQNNFGCSRFSGGCEIKFTLTNQKKTKSMSIVLKTPVRVVASTLRVTLAPGQHTVREGKLVLVEPGTLCGLACFMSDEFHYGHAFALLAGPDFTDGVTLSSQVTQLQDHNDLPDGCALEKPSGACSVFKYPFRSIVNTTGSTMDQRWAAQWRVRTNKPCINCEYTFHSTIGGGPESFTYKDNVVGSARFSLEDEAMELRCVASPSVVTFYTDTPASLPFEIVATAMSSAPIAANEVRQRAIYPKWWVFCDPTQLQMRDLSDNLVLEKYGSIRTGSSFSSRMTEGEGVTNISGLHFTGTAPTSTGALSGQVIIKLTAIATIYSNNKTGSVASGQTTHHCTTTVQVKRVVNDLTSKISVVLTGARQLCANTTNCDHWGATTDDVLRGLTITSSFTDVYKNGVEVVRTDARNTTIRPLGGPNTRPRNYSPAWKWSASPLGWTTAVVLDSEANPAVPHLQNGVSYTNGEVDLELFRSYTNLSVITMKYRTAVQSPGRKLVFEVCSSAYNSVRETDEYLLPCRRVYLWVTAPSSVTKHTMVWSAPREGPQYRGSSAACGRTPSELSLTLITYYALQNGPVDTRFFVTGVPIEYAVTFPNQEMVKVGSSLKEARLLVTNGVVSSGDANVDLMEEQPNFAVVRFYGAQLSGNITQRYRFGVQGVARSDPPEDFQATETTQRYLFIEPAEEYRTFEVSHNGVQLDDDCLSTRYLQTHKHSYRNFEPSPGLGWDFTQQAVAGLPFPVQATVRTPLQERAWTFQNAYVRVTKDSWTGCNDGGVLKIFSLKKSLSSIAIREGNLSKSWVLENAEGMIQTEMGSATIWPVFSAPCESCVMRFDLCFVSATTASECLRMTRATAAKSDSQPPYLSRTQLTKPFTVGIARPTAVTVKTQHLPLTWRPSMQPDLQHIRVGQPFSIELQQILIFANKWALASDGGLASVEVEAEWVSDTTSSLSTKLMKYGNGGFLHETHFQNGLPPLGGICGAARADFMAARARVAVSKNAWPFVRFAFSRPCSQCAVRVTYRMQHQAADAPSHSFLIRGYAEGDGVSLLPKIGATLSFAVSSCGTQWMLVLPAAHKAVRKRKNFAVTALRVDDHNIPTFDSTGPVLIIAKAQDSGSNGGGGSAVITSPHQVHRAVPSVEGSATLRMYLTRACYACSLSVENQHHHFTSVVDATQLIVLPTEDMNTPMLQKAFHRTQNSTWRFSMYAADELGDRSYVESGPTYSAFLPRYQVLVKHGHTIEVQKNNEVSQRVQHHGNETTLYQGNPGVRVTSGGSLYNGLPMDVRSSVMSAAAAGEVSLSVDSEPVEGFPVRFAFYSSDFHAPLATPPTYYYGTKRAPLLAASIPADTMMIESPSFSSCKSPVIDGNVCNMLVYTAGTLQKEGWVKYIWTRAHPKGAFVTISHTCDSCSLLHPTEVPLVEGRATFSIQSQGLVAEECKCQIAVAPPAFLYDEVKFVVEGDDQKERFFIVFKRSFVTEWAYGDSETLLIQKVTKTVNSSGANSSGMPPLTTISYTGHSIQDRVVDISLRSLDVTGHIVHLKDLVWEKAGYVIVDDTLMSPPGCFSCLHKEAVSLTRTCGVVIKNSTTVTLQGFFVAEGVCVLQSFAIAGLPHSTGASTGVGSVLTLNVQQFGHTELSPAGVLQTTGITSEGSPAAVVGVGVRFTINSLDIHGALCLGDHHSTIEITGGLSENDTSTHPSIKMTSGQATFFVDHPIPTDSVANPGGEGITYAMTTSLPVLSMKPSALQRGDVPQIDVVQVVGVSVGPVHFVTRPSHFDAFGVFINRRYTQGNESVLRYLLTHEHSFSASKRNTYLDAKQPPGGLQSQFYVPPAENPMRWVRGFPFEIEIVVRSHSGNVYAEGVSQRVRFTPVAIPCVEEDQAYFENSCLVGGVCESMRTESLPECRSSGWRVNGQEVASVFDSYTEAGRALLKVTYFGKPKGILRFTLSTTVRAFFTSSSQLKTPEQNTMLASVIFQEVYQIAIRGSPIKDCTFTSFPQWKYVFFSTIGCILSTLRSCNFLFISMLLKFCFPFWSVPHEGGLLAWCVISFKILFYCYYFLISDALCLLQAKRTTQQSPFSLTCCCWTSGGRFSWATTTAASPSQATAETATLWPACLRKTYVHPLIPFALTVRDIILSTLHPTLFHCKT